MAGKQMGPGGYEAELNRIRQLDDSIIPRLSAVTNAFTSLERALSAVRLSEFWEGESAKGATADIDEIRSKVTSILRIVEAVDSAVVEGNSTRREVAAAELPSASIDPFWANAAKGASFVVHPVLGPLAADKALGAIGDFLGNQREEAAREVVEKVETSLSEPTTKLIEASRAMNEVDYRSSKGPAENDDSTNDSEIDSLRIDSPDIGRGPSGYVPGGGGYQPGGGGGGVGEYVPPTPTNPTFPDYPTSPTYPGGPEDWEYDPDGPGGPGDTGVDDPSVDFPGGGVLPGGPGTGGGGGTGGGYPLHPGSTLPGGGIGGGAGSGIGGLVGGGAGAAAIAAGSKIAGIGSMGTLGGSALGGSSGAGQRTGGGLLGKSGVGGVGARGAGGFGSGVGGPGGVGGGVGGVGTGAGGAGGAAGSSGAAGSGMRPGMGMMGGAAGADEEEKAKRSGLGGPIAPKLEDDEERGPRAKGAQAGSRDEHAG
ncbi:hypothetical protein AB0N61_14245 [Microbacterium sp. NPDC089320]|uniref:hypothetical protein n=1 Tax=Microbacterium sp. NPDC089320 TaxID=3155182 RepID=UPI00342CC81A